MLNEKTHEKKKLMTNGQDKKEMLKAKRKKVT